MEGFVYVMSNEAMPGIVKVGFTERTPHQRALEMSAHEGLPAKMRVEYFALIDGSAYEIEQSAHRILAEFSVGKEWFRCDVLKAVMVIKSVSSGAMLSEKLHYESSDALRNRMEKERREAKDFENRRLQQENIRQTQLKAREAAIDFIRSEFYRLLPEVEAATSKIHAFLNFGTYPERMANTTKKDLFALIRYHQASVLLKKYASRPTVPNALQRLWSGDYREVPGFVIDEFIRRRTIAFNSPEFNNILFPNEARVLDDKEN